MSNKIKTVKTEYYRVPLEGNLVDALHGKHDFFELVIAKIELEEEEMERVIPIQEVLEELLSQKLLRMI